MKNKSSAIIAIVAIVVSAVVAVVAIVNNNNKGGEQSSENNSSQNGSNTGGDESQTSPMVGVWKYDDPNLADSFVYTFNAGGTGNYSASGNFTYTVDGNKLSITYDATEATFDTEFEIDGDRLNVKDSFGDDTFYKRAE